MWLACEKLCIRGNTIQVRSWLVQYTTLQRESRVPSGRREDGGGQDSAVARLLKLCGVEDLGSGRKDVVLIFRSGRDVMLSVWATPEGVLGVEFDTVVVEFCATVAKLSDVLEQAE